MRKRNKLLAMLLCTVMTAVLAGCSSSSETPGGSGDNNADKTKTEDSFDKGSGAAASGVKGVIDGLDVPSLEGRTIGVAVLGTDHEFDLKAYQGQIDRIEELGGKAVAVDGERNDSTSDNYLVGEELARNMYEDLGGKGRIAVFNGFYGVRVCGIRYDMMKYVAKDYPNIEFIEPELQDVITGAAEDARKKTLDLLTKEKEIDAIWLAWDTPCVGVAQACKEAGRDDIKIYAVDGSSTVLELVADPESAMYGDMAQNPYQIGQAAVDECARYLAGEEVPSTVYSAPVYVNKVNWENAVKELGIEIGKE